MVSTKENLLQASPFKQPSAELDTSNEASVSTHPAAEVHSPFKQPSAELVLSNEATAQPTTESLVLRSNIVTAHKILRKRNEINYNIRVLQKKAYKK